MKIIVFSLYWLISLAWSIFYGTVVGFIGGFISWYQNLVTSIKDHVLSGKAYPDRSIKNSFSIRLSTLKTIDRQSIEEVSGEHNKEVYPQPIKDSFFIFLVYLPLILYLPVKGFLCGPFHVFRQCLSYWDDKFNRAVRSSI